MELIGLLKGKDIMVGAIDVASDAVETPEQVAQVLRAALAYVAPEKLYPCTNCGMVPLAREVARPSCTRWPPARPWCGRSSRRPLPLLLLRVRGESALPEILGLAQGVVPPTGRERTGDHSGGSRT